MRGRAERMREGNGPTGAGGQGYHKVDLRRSRKGTSFEMLICVVEFLKSAKTVTL